MGQSPSASVYWGYDLAGMLDADFEFAGPRWITDGDDPEKVLARSFGWVEVKFPWPPGRPTGQRGEYLQVLAEVWDTTDYAAYRASRAEFRRLTDQEPCEFDTYGYHDEPSYCVRVKVSVRESPDWGSTELGNELPVDPQWPTQVARFMERLKLPVPSGKLPCWHVNCSYG